MFPDEITIRVAAECLTVAPLWDTIMTPFDLASGDTVVRGEWRIADPTIEPDNAGGLRANKALFTAIILQIFSNKRSSDPNIKEGTDPQGWWGDGFPDAPGAPPLGCELWRLFRGTLSPMVVQQAQNFVQVALQPLLIQAGGPVARFNVVASMDQMIGALYVLVRGFSQDGAMVFDQKWQYAWNQAVSGPQRSSPSFMVT